VRALEVLAYTALYTNSKTHKVSGVNEMQSELSPSPYYLLFYHPHGWRIQIRMSLSGTVLGRL